MRMSTRSSVGQKVWFRTAFLTPALIQLFVLLGASQPAHAVPAFARKYGLRCSACHESWPMLNYFGQKFKDNGYQLMNDRDSPIWQNPSYWPVTFRITPIWHRVSNGKVQVDAAANLLSEKRILTLTGIGGIYQIYHFRPVGDGNIFGQMGDNQLGVELMGHSYDDRTRYSAALLSTADGQVGLPFGANAYKRIHRILCR